MPIGQVSSFDGDPLRLSGARLSLRHFDRREGEVLLRADVLGHRLIDVVNARLVRAADLELARDGAEWVLAAVDTRRPRRLFGLLAPQTEILGWVHADPELEADVFSELDEDLATRLLGARTDEEIAAVLALMGFNSASAGVIEVSDTDPVRVGADADITDVAVLMTDDNLITIPVVDNVRRLLGVITVDDVLEATLPEDWRRREAAEPPDTRHGDAP